MTLRLNGSTSGYVEIDAPAVAGTSALTLPTGTGTLATQASVGLVKIVDQSFTAASTVSIDNCFTSAYDNYLINIAATNSSTGVFLQMRARNSGTDISGATEYGSSVIYITDAAGPTRLQSNNSYWLVGRLGDVSGAGLINIYGPALSSRTNVVGNYYERNSSDLRFDIYGGHRVTAASHDGFSLYVTSGTMTGKLRVYGYQN